MDKQTVNDLKLLVNSGEWHKITSFISYRKERLMSDLMRAQSYPEVCHIRGQIEEVERLKRLRDDVLAAEALILKKG